MNARQLRPSRSAALPALLAALSLALAGSLFAGTQGRVVGRVTDGAGKPLEGVKITITSPDITTFKVEKTTNKDGKWDHLLLDVTKHYTYKFEKQGYAPVEDTKFKIPAGEMNAAYEMKLYDAKSAAPAAAVAKSQSDPFVAAYNESVEKFNAGDVDGSMVKVQEAIKAGPDRMNGYDLGAKIAKAKKDWDHVIEWGEKALALDADNPPLIAIVAEAYGAKGNKEKVKEYEGKLASASPDDPTVISKQYNEAVGFYNKGDFKNAEPILKKVVAAKPDNAEAHYLIGMCYVNLNKIPEMKTHLSEYLKLSPSGKDAGSAKEMLEAFK